MGGTRVGRENGNLLPMLKQARLCYGSTGVGFPSVCYEYVLLPWVVEEAVLANGLVEESQVGNPNRDREKK